MLGMLFIDLMNPRFYIENPLMLIFLAFEIWMLIDAIRNKEWMWAVFIFVFPVLNAILYYFMVYRAARPSATSGFELPGAVQRGQIKELQAKIHHLDKAHHHAQLGDIYFEQGKLQEAEKCYQAAFEREPSDIDIRAHLGQCLLRTGKPQEALSLLEDVCKEDPRHEYGYSMMALAEALTVQGQKQRAMEVWRNVLSNHSYARAKVQLAELYAEQGLNAQARAELAEVVADDAHIPKFQRKREKVWVARAKALLKKIGP
jgi:hypothetical protein